MSAIALWDSATLIPALKVLYPNQDDFKEAMLRHNEFFNCHPYTGNAVIGVSLALEEQRAAKAHFRRGHFLHQGGAWDRCPASATRCSRPPL